jgi:alkylated DNA repair dioxygenase AlkB
MLNAILYPDQGALQSHQDGAVGWVLAFSFGASCMFHYGKSQNVLETGVSIKLESGDAVLFDGQVNHFH